MSCNEFTEVTPVSDPYKAHNAEEDVKCLASLVSKVVTEHGDKQVQENSLPAKAAYFNLLSSKAHAKNNAWLIKISCIWYNENSNC